VNWLVRLAGVVPRFFYSTKIISPKRLTSKIHSPYICEKKEMTPTIAKNQMLIMNRRRIQEPVCRHEYKYAILGGIGFHGNSTVDANTITFFCPKCKTIFLKERFNLH